MFFCAKRNWSDFVFFSRVNVNFIKPVNNLFVVVDLVSASNLPCCLLHNYFKRNCIYAANWLYNREKLRGWFCSLQVGNKVYSNTKSREHQRNHMHFQFCKGYLLKTGDIPAKLHLVYLSIMKRVFFNWAIRKMRKK